MKKNYLVILLFTFGITQAQKNQFLDYSNFNTEDLKTEILIKNTSPLSSLGKNNDTYGMYGFLQAYKELANNSTNNTFSKLQQLKAICKPINYSNIAKIGLLHTTYESVTEDSFVNGDVTINNNLVTRNTSDYIFNQHTSTIISPLVQTKKGLQTTYILEPDFFINNTNNQISSIKADFDDSSGLYALEINSPIQVTYNQEGNKRIHFILELDNNQVIHRYASINIELSNTDIRNQRNMATNEIISGVTADLSDYAGATNFAGLGEYEVFLGADNVLDKPIFVIDGFDPADTRNIAAVYNLLSYDNNGTPENLGDRIRNEENFDIVIINFPQYFKLSDGSLQSMSNSTDVNTDGVIDVNDYPGSTLVDGGSDFIERNAMIVAEVISTINSQKTGSEQNVVLGPSMGGLITRYALNYMEQQGLNHDTRLWLSFDSPHRGANVPIGFQHLFNYLAYGLDTWAGDFSMEAIRPIVDGMLKSPAARQMLVDHFEPHLAAGEIAEFDTSITLPVAHAYNASFYSKINSLTSSGFPETTRNISIINGSGIGYSYYHKNGDPVSPGDQVLDAFLEGVATLTDAYFDVWFTPYANQEVIVDDIWIDAPWICFCDIYADANSKAKTYTDGIDAAPGGLFDLGALAASFGGSDPTMDAFFAALTVDYFNFIPATSALALNDTNLDWHQNISIGTPDTPWDGITSSTSTQTPFVNWFMPDNNEAHVTLTTDNVAFAWEEIVEPLPLNVDETILAENSIELLNNPTQANQITLQSTLKNNNHLHINIYDVNGRKVLEQKTENKPIIQLKTTITTGLYLITVTNIDNINLLTAKMVITN